MKKIKSTMVGFLLSTSIFLFMGQTNKADNKGRYQLVNYAVQGYSTKLYETVFDTQTGKVVKRSWSDESQYQKNNWCLKYGKNNRKW